MKTRTPESRVKEARELRQQRRPQPIVDDDGNLMSKQRGEPIKVLSPEERGGKKSKPASDPVVEVLATVGSESAEAEEIVIEDEPKKSKGKKKAD